MINVLIPASGRGSRFDSTGRYHYPKPLLEIQGEPMIKKVVDNIGLKGRYIFLVLKEHCEKYCLNYLLPLICAKDENECVVIQVDSVTEGAACTALLAKGLINNDDELIIANSDQLVHWNPEHFLQYVRGKKADGAMLTFNAVADKWSFARMAPETNVITEVAEKNPISNHATVGIYYWKSGKDFVRSAELMIDKDIRFKNEFYICPTYNELLLDGAKILSYPVAEMIPLGTPEDFDRYVGSL